MFDDQPIYMMAHMKWFAEKINGHYYVGEVDGIPVGEVRFETSAETTISVTVAEQWRGKGYGTELIKQGSQLIGGTIYAYIKSDNVASIKAFSKAGYGDMGEVEYKGQTARRLIWG